MCFNKFQRVCLEFCNTSIHLYITQYTIYTFHQVQYTQYTTSMHTMCIHFIKFIVIQWMYTFHCSTLYKCNEYIFCNTMYIFYCDTHSIYTFHCSMYNFNAYISRNYKNVQVKYIYISL